MAGIVPTTASFALHRVKWRSCALRQHKVCWATEDNDGHAEVIRSYQDQHCASTVAGYFTLYT
jgi:hypothetical protein